MNEDQLSLEDPPAAAPGPTLLRRIGAMVAPIARDSGALIDDEELIEVARQVCDAFARSDAVGGLTRAEIQARVDGRADPATFDARFNVFVRLELLRPLLDKKHQQRYTLNPAGMVGLLVFERIGQRGGIDELLTLLDRTKGALAAGSADPVLISEALARMRGMLSVYADELSRLTRTAPLAELIAERRYHDHSGLFGEVKSLNDLVSERMPQLDPHAYRVVVEAQRYVDTVQDMVERVLDEGGEARDFSVLDPEEYRAAALTAHPEDLAEVFASVVFDPPSPWVDAAAILDALDAQRPRKRLRERPAEPPGKPHSDPIADLERRAAAEKRQRALAAEQHLQGETERELTATIRGLSWPAAARLLADLLALDSDSDQPYAAKIGDALFVDPEGTITYSSPVTLTADRPKLPTDQLAEAGEATRE